MLLTVLKLLRFLAIPIVLISCKNRKCKEPSQNSKSKLIVEYTIIYGVPVFVSVYITEFLYGHLMASNYIPIYSQIVLCLSKHFSFSTSCLIVTELFEFILIVALLAAFKDVHNYCKKALKRR